MPIYKKVNHDFFKTWNAHMAYVLGFFVADGYMIKNKRGAHFIDFYITDLSLLKDIRELLESNHTISKRKRVNKNWKVGYRLQVGSKEMFKDLENLGLSQNKSKTIRMVSVPREFLGDFVRGYFDGDGSVDFGEYYAKDRGKTRRIFSLRFTSGSRLFLEDLHDRLGCVVHRGFITTKKSGNRITGYTLSFSHNDGLALFKLMYNNSEHDVLLRRKYDIFKKAMTALYKRP